MSREAELTGLSRLLKSAVHPAWISPQTHFSDSDHCSSGMAVVTLRSLPAHRPDANPASLAAPPEAIVAWIHASCGIGMGSFRKRRPLKVIASAVC
jgi:hypothetical protein